MESERTPKKMRQDLYHRLIEVAKERGEEVFEVEIDFNTPRHREIGAYLKRLEELKNRPSQITERTKDKEIIEKQVHFPNDDVPKFLERLRELKNRPSSITEPTAYCPDHYSMSSY